MDLGPGWPWASFCGIHSVEQWRPYLRQGVRDRLTPKVVLSFPHAHHGMCKPALTYTNTTHKRQRGNGPSLPRWNFEMDTKTTMDTAEYMSSNFKSYKLTRSHMAHHH